MLAAEDALEAVARDLAAIGPRDPVLDEADAIRRVRDDLGLYRKALEGRPDEAARLARLEADARALLARASPRRSIARRRRIAPHPSGASKERVQGLAQRAGRARGRLLDAPGARPCSKAARACPGARPARPVPAPDALRLAEALVEAVERAQAEGDLEAQLASSRAELARLERQADVELRGLPLWSGSLDDLEALAVPSIATLDRFEAEFRAADETLDRLAADLAEARGREGRARPRDRPRARSPARSRPRRSWPLAGPAATTGGGPIRRAWLGREPVDDPPGSPTTSKAAVRSADDLADRLRREADAVAEQAQRAVEAPRAARPRSPTSVEARDRAEAGPATALKTRWHDTWEPLGIDPLPPREMKDWVAIRRADLVRQAKGSATRRLEVDQKAARIEEIKAGRWGGTWPGWASPRPNRSSRSPRSWPGRGRASTGWTSPSASRPPGRPGEGRGRSRRPGDRDGPRPSSPSGCSPTPRLRRPLAVLARFDELAGLLREVVDLRGKIDEQGRVEARFEADVRALAGSAGPCLVRGGPPALAGQACLAPS